MAEIIISGATKVSEYFVAPITVPFRYMWNYKSYLEHLKKEVENLDGTRNSVQHSVEDAIRKGEEIEKHVQSWLPRAENIIREASELVNEDNHQQANLQCFRGFSCPNLKKRYQLSKEAAGKLKDVVGLKQTAAEFKQVSYRTIPEQTCLQPIKGHQDFESRNSILKDVINALSTSDVNMVGIYGMGGVGKTTLAKQVATQAKRDRLFDKIIFVEVSESPDIKNIQGVIADNLGLQFTEDTTSGRANRLCDRLKKEEKILLILDNIWGSIDFEKVGIPFENDRKGLKLLLTTRNRNVLTNMVDSQRNFPIQTLNDEDAWSFFKSITGTRVEQPDLNFTALQVAKACGGMPVAIVTIARALKEKGENEWKSALRELQTPPLESIGGITKEVYTSIKLSYNYLETKELKEIFLLCSRMGRTNDASVRDLFRYGWGLGLFKKFNTMEEALCNVYTSVNQLKATSLLLDTPESEEFDTYDTPNSERFAMHDVICYVARTIASMDQHVSTVIDNVIPRSWADENMLRECTSITLHNIDDLPENLPLVCPALKFLYMKPKESSFRIPDNFFARMSGLKVLHLVKMDLQTLPSLNCLVNDLNVLCLNQCILGDTTVIGNLKKLEILSFCNSNVEELPEQMRQLTELRLLDLSNCFKLSVIHPNVLSSLTKLEALYMGNTSINWVVERPNTERSYVSVNELKQLCQLTLLEIHIPDAKMLKGLLSSELKRYKILIGDEWIKWGGPYHSKTSRMLKLSLHTNEDGIISQLLGIEELELGEVVGARNLLDDLHRTGFPTLKHLKVHYNSHCLESVSCGALPLLESLIVERMDGLEKICNRPLGAESFGQLRTIRVSWCYKLNNIFSLSTVTALPQLQEINVYDCKNMEEIFAIGEQDDGNNNEVVHEMKFSQLRILSLGRLPRLNSFCCKVKTASPLQSTSDKNAREIISDEELDIPTSLFDDKVVAPNLEILDVTGIPVEKIWHNLLPMMSSCVQNLTELIIADCDNLKELFSSSTVIKEESRKEERRDTISFPKLNYLELKNLGKLTRLWSGYSIEFPSLKTFMIWNCPELETFIFDDKVRVPNLERMKIYCINNLKMIWHNQLDGDSFRQLKSMQVTRCRKLLTLFPSKNMCERLLSLESLEVTSCDSLEEIFNLQGIIPEEGNSSAATTQSFPKLNFLKIKSLAKLTRLWSGYSIEFSSLKKFTICNCPELKTFIFDDKVVSPNLEVLEVRNIHVERIWHNLLPTMSSCVQNLTRLSIVGCRNLKVLFPSSMVITDESRKEERRDKISFPKLKYLELSTLAKLTGLSSGYYIEFPSLETFTINKCPELETFIFDDKIRVPNLEVMEIEDMDNLKMIWHNQLDWDSFRKLKSLKVNGCRKLLTLFPSKNMCERLLSLESLEVSDCDSLEEIFNLQGIIPEEGNSLAATTQPRELSFSNLQNLSVTSCESLKNLFANEGVSAQEVPVRFCFPKLTSLELLWLPKLRNFYPGKHKVKCPVLKKLKLSGLGTDEECQMQQSLLLKEVVSPNLEVLEVRNIHVERIWHNLLPTMSSCVQNLTRLIIEDCDNLKELFPSSLVITEESREEERRDKISFPKLNYLELSTLAKLTGLSSGYYIEFPSLKTFKISRCPELETFIFDDKVRAPDLEKMEIMYMHNLKMIWHNQLDGDSFCKLKSLQVEYCHELLTLFQSNMCERLLSLESLRVSKCRTLMNLMPPSASFQNLILLKVDGCGSLENVVTSSTAKSLVMLLSMDISNCKNITEVVGNQGDVTNDKIIFSNLKYLLLKNLRGLATFCSSSCTLEFPYLEKLNVSDCRNLKIFSQGELITQRLQKVKINYKLIKLCRDRAIQQFHEKEISTSDHHASSSDLNRAIQQFHEKEISTSDDDASSSDDVE
ncbi:hypothetical protein ACOSQ3_008898 [Xanthoceras sorbifolium]